MKPITYETLCKAMIQQNGGVFILKPEYLEKSKKLRFEIEELENGQIKLIDKKYIKY